MFKPPRGIGPANAFAGTKFHTKGLLHTMRRTLTTMIAALGLTLSATAADWRDNRDRDDYPPDTLFFGNEASLDLFGSVSIGQETINHISNDRIEDNGRLGAGLGLNYFFTRNIGLGADAYTENTAHSFVDNTS